MNTTEVSIRCLLASTAELGLLAILTVVGFHFAVS